MSIQIITTTDIQVPAHFMADKIIRQLDLGKRVLWFVPGGSAISVVIEAAKIISTHPHKNLTFTLTDERYGDIGHKDSNWQQLLERGLSLPEARLVPVLTGGDLITTTSKFNYALEQEIENADYLIGFFGAGKDAHTAGIFPETMAVTAETWAFGYKTPAYDRITMTPRAISELDEAVLFTQGTEKWEVIEGLSKEINIREAPVQILKNVPTLTIFTDYHK